MSAPKFTPGPWKVIKPGHGSATQYKCVQIGADDRYTTLEMLPADARLIAAAPELYAVLQAIVSAWDSISEDAQVPDELNGGVIEDARAALAKARGEA